MGGSALKPRGTARLAGAVRTGLTVAMLAGGAAGCGKFYWTKPHSTVEEFERDSEACARQTSENPTAAANGVVDMKAYRACLTTRGYVRRQHATPPADGYRGFE
jgi:hypothetical protein